MLILTATGQSASCGSYTSFLAIKATQAEGLLCLIPKAEVAARSAKVRGGSLLWLRFTDFLERAQLTAADVQMQQRQGRFDIQCVAQMLHHSSLQNGNEPG